MELLIRNSTPLFRNDTGRFVLNIGDDSNFFRHSIGISALLIFAYAVVLVIGLSGNPIVLAVVWKDRKMRTVTNYFIANLALSDLLVVIVCVPATLTGNLISPWILGLFLCKAVAYLQGVSVCASVNTLVAISVDRFLAICYPMKHQITPSGCRAIIVTIWLFSFALIVPWTIYFRLTPIGWAGDHVLHVCREKWPSEKMSIIYFIVANLIMCYLLPLLVISVCYFFIWLRVCNRKMPGGERQAKSFEDIIHRSRVKVIKMLAVVVVAFMVSWLPLYAIFTRIKVGEAIKEESTEEFVIQVAAPVAQWLGASNSCINPILYAFFNGKFRAGFRIIFFGRQTQNGNAKSCKNTTLRTSDRKVSKAKMSQKYKPSAASV